MRLSRPVKCFSFFTLAEKRLLKDLICGDQESLLSIWIPKHLDLETKDNSFCIPANFFSDIRVRFLSWECWDFLRRHDRFRRFPKKPEVFRSFPNTSEVCRRRSFHLLFTSKIRDREEGIVIYSFYTWFSFLTWVWVNIFLEIVSSKTATTHIFQSGVRNRSAGVSGREIEVFNPQAWDSRLRRESWQV